MNQSIIKIPLYPYLNFETANKHVGKKDYNIPGLVDTGIVYSTLNARSALEIGLRSLKIQQGDEMLFPAYQCPVAVYAAVKAGIKPIFYKINDDCSLNISDIEQKISFRTKAVLIVHYFGFPNSIAEIRKICDKLKIYLIEDCALSFYGVCDNLPIGSIGDFSIASLYKFFPVYDGGFLKFENKELARNVKIKSSHLFFQIKSALNTIEMGSELKNGINVRKHLFQLKDRTWTGIKSFGKKSPNRPAPIIRKKRNPYTPELINDSYSRNEMPIFSKIVYKITDKNKLIGIRRRNFNILLKALKNVPGNRPLFDKLPPEVVPYDFPIISQKADNLAKEFRDKHVRIARFAEYLWGDMDKNTCPVSSFYSKHCIQLPIHQSLTSEDMHYMISIIEEFI